MVSTPSAFHLRDRRSSASPKTKRCFLRSVRIDRRSGIRWTVNAYSVINIAVPVADDRQVARLTEGDGERRESKRRDAEGITDADNAKLAEQELSRRRTENANVVDSVTIPVASDGQITILAEGHGLIRRPAGVGVAQQELWRADRVEDADGVAACFSDLGGEGVVAAKPALKLRSARDGKGGRRYVSPAT